MKRRWLIVVLLAPLAIVAVLIIAYQVDRRLRPNLYRPGHRHCIKQTGLGFKMYAGDHIEHWPSHTNGYGDALLLTLPYLNNAYSLLTGPGFDSAVFEHAHKTGTDVPEEECGRVYIQGLTESNAPNLIVLFDKRPSRGGDHCPARPFFPRPLLREVLFHDAHSEVYLEQDWPSVVTQQVEWLVDAWFKKLRCERELVQAHGFALCPRDTACRCIPFVLHFSRNMEMIL